MLEVNVLKGYNTERGFLGPYEQSYLSSHGFGETNIIDEGGETVVYRKPGDNFVTKAVRDNDSKKWNKTARNAADRAEALVVGGEIGASPPAYRVEDRTVRQIYVNLEGFSLEDALRNADKKAVRRTLEGIKKFHDRGIHFRDTSLSNIYDSARTGYVTVDSTNIGYTRRESKKYTMGDLAQTLWEADNRGIGDLYFDGVGDIYGSRVQDELGDIRIEQQRTGKVDRTELLPLSPSELRRAAA